METLERRDLLSGSSLNEIETFSANSQGPISVEQTGQYSSAWASAAHLTLSFAPDGTDISGRPNSLSNTLGPISSTAEWRETVLRAFQTWAEQANINIGVVGDGGQPFGTGGATQGDPRFGDIRIGAIPMASDVLAMSVPHDDLSSGTWAGDVLFNSLGSLETLDDLFSVALHEAGHVLGLKHSSDVSSPMYKHGVSAAVAPTSEDIANLQQLYGQRNLDRNELDKPNDKIKNATRIRNTGSLGGRIPLIVYGDIPANTDVDYYYLSPLSNYTGPITFELRSAGKSLLSPQLTVLNEAEEILDVVSSTGPEGDVVSLTIPETEEGATYFLKVEAAESGFTTGSYSLVTTLDQKLTIERSDIDAIALGGFEFLRQSEMHQLFLSKTTPFFNDDLHVNDNFAFATSLTTVPGFEQFAQYQTEGSLSDATDVDIYSFKSAEIGKRQTQVMTVSLRALERGGLISKVTVLDKNQVELPGRILVNGNGQYVLQVSDIQDRETYFVKVEADVPGETSGQGNYAMKIAFGDKVAEQQTIAQGTLNSSTTVDAHNLFVGQTQLFHLGLSATAVDQSSLAMIWLSIYDSDGNPVYRVATKPGETRTARSVVLTPGVYTVRVSMPETKGEILPELSYRVLGAAVAEPIGPAITDPTETPIYTCADPTDEFCYPGGIVTPDPWISTPDPVPPPLPLPEPPWMDPNVWFWSVDWLDPMAV